MGTPLDDLYKRFQAKLEEDLTGKSSLIFALVDVAISKSYKACVHSLTYKLDDSEFDEDGNITNEYEGFFDETLDSDELELLALWMYYEWNRRKQQKLINQRRDVGTSDFNRLEDKAKTLREVTSIMKDIMFEIKDLKNEFNTYKYN